MSVDVLLFLLRLVSAFLLLAFLAGVAWLIYQDMRVTAADLSDRQRRHGRLLRVNPEDGSFSEEESYPLLSVTSIGRAPTNTIVIDDSYASAEHLLITLRGRQWWVEDLDSRNGTLLNGLPLLDMAVLTAGDIVTVGNVQLRVEFETRHKE